MLDVIIGADCWQSSSFFSFSSAQSFRDAQSEKSRKKDFASGTHPYVLWRWRAVRGGKPPLAARPVGNSPTRRKFLRTYELGPHHPRSRVIKLGIRHPRKKERKTDRSERLVVLYMMRISKVPVRRRVKPRRPKRFSCWCAYFFASFFGQTIQRTTVST